MKTILSILTTIFFTASVYAQTPLKLVKERVGNPDILKYWEIGEQRNVNNVSMLRLQGENNYDFITNVFYTPCHAIIGLVEEKAKAEALLSAEHNPITESYISSVSGGQIAIFFSRPTKVLAEPSNFSIQVLDEDGTVIWSDVLEMEQPYYYRWEIWYYYRVINLPVAVGENFIIKVDDAGTKESFKFSINQLPYGAEPPQFDLSLKQNNF